MASSQAGKVTRKLTVEVEMESAPDIVWNALRDFSTLFPKAFPGIYSNIQILKGDGKSVGSVRLINYVKGKSVITCAKEKIESFDDEGKSLSYSVIDGDMLKFYKDFKCSLDVVPDEDGSVVKWSSQFEITSEKSPTTCALKEFAVVNLQALDDYLLKNY